MVYIAFIVGFLLGALVAALILLVIGLKDILDQYNEDYKNKTESTKKTD